MLTQLPYTAKIYAVITCFFFFFSLEITKITLIFKLIILSKATDKAEELKLFCSRLEIDYLIIHFYYWVLL